MKGGDHVTTLTPLLAVYVIECGDLGVIACMRLGVSIIVLLCTYKIAGLLPWSLVGWLNHYSIALFLGRNVRDQCCHWVVEMSLSC